MDREGAMNVVDRGLAKERSMEAMSRIRSENQETQKQTKEKSRNRKILY
jgi:hypothetical protein